MRLTNAYRSGFKFAVVTVALFALLIYLCACSEAEPKHTVKGCLNDYTWSELSEVSKELAEQTEKFMASGTEEDYIGLAKEYNLCTSEGALDGSQTKEVILSNGTKTSVVLTGICEDVSSAGDRVGLTFMFKDIVDVKPMDETATTPWTWENSSLRKYLNSDFASTLPEDLVAVVKEVEKRTEIEPESSNVDVHGEREVTFDRYWCFSAEELHSYLSTSGGSMVIFDNTYSLLDDVSEYPHGTTSILQKKGFLRNPILVIGGSVRLLVQSREKNYRNRFLQ